MLVWDASNRHIAEEFRVIQGRILRQSFAVNGAGAPAMGNLLMITSALQGEGKSFCALNLAGEIARQGDRDVLLVDADPNPQGLAQRMGVRGPGLLDLARRSGLIAERIAVPTAVAHLDFLPFGNNGSGSAELFASRRMAEAIETLARSRPDRLVIFDAPPCLGSSTPHTLAPIVGQIALVVAAGRTQEGDIEAALDLLHANQNVSVLLNKAPSWLAHSFGSYAYGSTAAN
jgi:Mrp family chromosome partitioning ATPase